MIYVTKLAENTLHSLRNSVNKGKRACIHVALCMQNPATLITTLSILFNQENEVHFFLFDSSVVVDAHILGTNMQMKNFLLGFCAC